MILYFGRWAGLSLKSSEENNLFVYVDKYLLFCAIIVEFVENFKYWKKK